LKLLIESTRENDPDPKSRDNYLNSLFDSVCMSTFSDCRFVKHLNFLLSNIIAFNSFTEHSPPPPFSASEYNEIPQDADNTNLPTYAKFSAKLRKKTDRLKQKISTAKSNRASLNVEGNIDTHNLRHPLSISL